MLGAVGARNRKDTDMNTHGKRIHGFGMVMLLALAAACPGRAFCEEGAMVTSKDIKSALGRDLEVGTPVAQDGYSVAEASPQIGLTTIFFDLDSAALRPESYRQLAEVAAALKDLGLDSGKDLVVASDGQPAAKILIEGHTCDLGTEEHNMNLSSKRAVAVRDYLVSQGVRGELLETHGWGEGRPVAPNVDGQRPLNRRVVFVRRVRGEGNRDLIESSEARRPCLDVRFTALAVSNNNQTYTDDAIRTLYSGDQLQLRLEARRGCYAYVLLRNASSRVVCLFPPESAGAGLWLNPGDARELPGAAAGGWFTLNDPAGEEILYVIATQKPVESPKRVMDLLVRAGNTLTAETLEREGGVHKPELRMLVIDHRPLQ